MSGANLPNVVKLFGEIEAAIEDERHDDVVKLATQVLAESPEDKDAQQVKAIALVKMGKFDEALKVIPAQQHFERAYCQFRSNQLTEALATLKAAASKELKFSYLQAQVNYKMENFKEAADILEGVLKTAELEEGFRLEVLTNFVASKAASLQKLDINDKDLKKTFELAFNAAFFCLRQGDLVSAESFLLLSEKLCRESFAGSPEDDEDMRNELAPIQVQLGFIHQQLNKEDEAVEIYNSVLKTKSGDEAVRAVASNNVVSIKQDHQLFDSVKKLKTASGEAALQKLLSSQRRTIAFNHALLHLYTHKYQQCQEDVDALRKEYPTSELPYLILASMTLNEKKLPAAIEQLEGFLGKIVNPVFVPLTLAQLHLSEGNTDKAITSLQAVSNIDQYPLVVALLVTCFEKLGRAEEAFGLVGKISSSQNDVIAEFCAAFLLRHRRAKEAAAIYEQMVKRDQKNVKAVSGLIKSYSFFDPSLAEKYEASLPSLPTVSVEVLESLISKLSYKSFKSIVAKEESAHKEPVGAKAAAADKTKTKAKKPKKKKKLLPKDPSAPVDPERWIPMKFRSYYKVKGGKKGGKGTRDKEMGKGASQGAVIAPNLAPLPAAAAAAAAASSSGSKAQPASPAQSSAPAPTPAANAGAGGQKKGKGKGKA